MTEVVAGAASGNFWKPPNGTYILELIEVEERLQVKGFGGELKDKWAFHFMLYNLDGTPYLNEDGEHAEFVAEETMSLDVKSRARPFFNALLNRDIEDGEKSSAIIAEAMNNKAMGQFGNNQNGKPGKLKVMIAQPNAPTAAGGE